ncbi:hypothetical protein C0585_07700 [Candidatus Woesearchaeota archaeon]|nr:MAG: hypothetical protein C0585_07700 [Candidatus Woesearchaeota archaeon]
MKDNIPVLMDKSQTILDTFCNLLKVPRDTLPKTEEIQQTLSNLPYLLDDIPEEFRGDELIRCCLAISTGLFDSALNYIWNLTIINLRDKMRLFGLEIIEKMNPDFKIKRFDNNDYSDSEILIKCLELGIINDESYYILNKNREMRNNCSTAHPPKSKIAAFELLSFIQTCNNHCLKQKTEIKGLDIKDFFNFIENQNPTEEIFSFWKNKINSTNHIQKDYILKALFGLFCDPNLERYKRNNSLFFLQKFIGTFSRKEIDSFLEIFNEYIVKNDEPRRKAATQLMQKLELFQEVPDWVIFNKFKIILNNLYNAHMNANNFYNEAPFAKELFDLSNQVQRPIQIKHQYVNVVLMTIIGNGYGRSWSSINYYEEMIKNFSDQEIIFMFQILDSDEKNLINDRLDNSALCKHHLKLTIELLDYNNLPTSVQKKYDNWTKKLTKY